MGNSPATDGWNHDLYPDSKKMKTDGDGTFLVLTYFIYYLLSYFSCKPKRIVLIPFLFFFLSRND